MHNEQWTKEEVFANLKDKMEKASTVVFNIANKENVSLRDAAYIVALQRIAKEWR